jgi:hypothetical protein
VEVTVWTVAVAVAGLVVGGVLMTAQVIAVFRPRAKWTIDNIYGGSPDNTDPVAFFAFNQGLAWADVFFWLPIQLVGSVGMLLGQKWGFLMALVGSVPFWYTAITIYFWDRALQIRKNTFVYWVLIWGVFPAFGVTEGIYCFLRLLG